LLFAGLFRPIACRSFLPCERKYLVQALGQSVHNCVHTLATHLFSAGSGQMAHIYVLCRGALDCGLCPFPSAHLRFLFANMFAVRSLFACKRMKTNARVNGHIVTTQRATCVHTLGIIFLRSANGVWSKRTVKRIEVSWSLSDASPRRELWLTLLSKNEQG